MSGSSSSEQEIFDHLIASASNSGEEDLPKRKAACLDDVLGDFFEMNIPADTPKEAPKKAPPKKQAKTEKVTIYTQFEMLVRCLVFDVIFYNLFVQIKDDEEHPLYDQAMKQAATRDKIKQNLRDHFEPILTMIAEKSPDQMARIYKFLETDVSQEMHLFKKPDESGSAFEDPWTGQEYEQANKDIHAMFVFTKDEKYVSLYVDRRAKDLIHFYHALVHFSDYVYATIKELVPEEHYVDEYTEEAFDEAWAAIVGEKCQDTALKKWTMPKGPDKNPLIVRLVAFRKFLEKAQKLL